MYSNNEDDLQSVAIIGMSGRFPDADNVERFWENLARGVESIRHFNDAELLQFGVDTQLLRDPYYVKSGVIIDNIDMFDADFFGLSPREAELMDPQQRFLIECAYEAFEHAGYVPNICKQLIGVYVGTDISSYFLHNLLPRQDIMRNQSELLMTYVNTAVATQIAYRLNLHGPCLDINTACSTSLVAIHLACKSLLCYECDMAIAGGASIDALPKRGYLYRDGGILSPDGHCCAFDEEAQGTVAGQGVGILVLKRLEEARADKDTIYAIIRGSAVNNDGSQKVGYTAPSIEGQRQVINQALAAANIDASSIDYIECHGTATRLGDPIEVAALGEVFPQTIKDSPIYIGSVKTNIGHLNTAAGVAGAIKTVQALRYQQLPPSLNFNKPNPKIDFASTALQVNEKLRPWPESNTPRRAGVSSFGIGGTNAHLIMEEADILPASISQRNVYLLSLSAKTPEALREKNKALMNYLESNAEGSLLNAAFTLNVGRAAFDWRQTIVCQSHYEAVSLLKKAGKQQAKICVPKKAPKIAMLFPGQGAQYTNMAKGLYQKEPVFYNALTKCHHLLQSMTGHNIIDILYPDSEKSRTAVLQDTRFSQLVIFAVEYALTCLWREWGVNPEFLFGHSLGEYVAACVAGVFSLEDALRLVAARAEMMANLTPGAMLAVNLSEDEITQYLNDDCNLAAINGPRWCVLSGSTHAIERVESKIAGLAKANRLAVSHAFHSHLMEPIIKEYSTVVRKIKLCSPSIPFISSMTGDWITESEALDPIYWANQLRNPVQFSKGIKKLLSIPNVIFLEMGPNSTLQTLLRQNTQHCHAFGSCRHPSDEIDDAIYICQTVGKLWELGTAINWENFYKYEKCYRISLPTYPFERKRYWIESSLASVNILSTVESTLTSKSVHLRPDGILTPLVTPSNLLEEEVAAIWEDLLGIKNIGVNDNFFELGGHSLLATQFTSRIYDKYQLRLSLSNFFTSPTIYEVVQMLTQQQLEGISEESLNELLSEIEIN